MMRSAIRLLACVSLAQLALAGPAQAAQCWSAEEIGAARIRQFEAMMLGVGLRCAHHGNNFRARVDQFFKGQRKAIDEADKVLRARYDASNKAGKIAYDQFLTGLVNHYGAGRTDPQTCQTFSALAEALGSKSDDREMLSTISIEMVRDPKLDAPRCPKR